MLPCNESHKRNPPEDGPNLHLFAVLHGFAAPFGDASRCSCLAQIALDWRLWQCAKDAFRLYFSLGKRFASHVAYRHPVCVRLAALAQTGIRSMPYARNPGFHSLSLVRKHSAIPLPDGKQLFPRLTSQRKQLSHSLKAALRLWRQRKRYAQAQQRWSWGFFAPFPHHTLKMVTP